VEIPAVPFCQDMGNHCLGPDIHGITIMAGNSRLDLRSPGLFIISVDRLVSCCSFIGRSKQEGDFVQTVERFSSVLRLDIKPSFRSLMHPSRPLAKRLRLTSVIRLRVF